MGWQRGGYYVRGEECGFSVSEGFSLGIKGGILAGGSWGTGSFGGTFGIWEEYAGEDFGGV